MERQLYMATILVVEDDNEIRQIEKDYLAREGYEVLESDDGDDALDVFRESKPDLVVLDLNLPFLDGVEVCKEIRKSSGVPIIMVTARTKEIDELIGLEVGADDYLKKPFSPKILVARVQALLKRPEYINDSKVINIGNLSIDLEKRLVHKSGELINLTTTQFNILSLMAINKGRVFERYDLIERVSDDMPDIFDRTIDSHIKNIRKLIEADSKNPKYILTVRGKGYRFCDNF